MPLAISLKLGVMAAGELAALVHAVGGVVGGHGLQRADLQGPPQRLLVRRLAQGRRAHPHRTLEPRPVEVARGQGQVLGAGLAPDLVPLAAGAVDDAGTLGGADVEDHQGLVDQRGAGDGPADRLDLAEPRVRGHVVARRAVAAGEQALAHPADHAVVLGMHADHQAVRARGVEHVQELPVLDAQPVVGQEHLERAVARARQAAAAPRPAPRAAGRTGSCGRRSRPRHRARRRRGSPRPPRSGWCRHAAPRTGSPSWCRRSRPRRSRWRRCRRSSARRR